MSLTGKDIAEIARLLDASDFASLDLTMGDFRLRMRRNGAGGNWRDTAGDAERLQEPQTDPTPIEGAPSTAAAQAGEADVLAPLPGNFYIAPRPGEPPFIAVGDRVSEDSIIGIIEVMKLMNSVRAGVAGEVVAILAENGSGVEKGQPLIRVKVG